MLDRSGGRSATGRLERDRPAQPPLRSATARRGTAPVPMSVRKRRQEVLTVLGSAAVLTLLCTVAFGGHVPGAAHPRGRAAHHLRGAAEPGQPGGRGPRRIVRRRPRPAGRDRRQDGLRTATVGRATPGAPSHRQLTASEPSAVAAASISDRGAADS